MRIAPLVIALLSLVAMVSAARADDGEVCASNGHPAAEIAACTRVIVAPSTSNNQKATAYYNRGNSYAAKGDQDRAITDFNKAIALKPDYAKAYTNRGYSYAAKGDHDRAIADYTKAVALKPDHANAYSNRGASYAAKGDHDRAIADYTKAIALKSDYAGAYYNRGLHYAAKGDHDRAFADFETAAALYPAGSKDRADAERRRDRLQAKVPAAKPVIAAAPAKPAHAPAVTATPAATLGKRVALVIGNSAYKAVPALPNAKRDAEAVARALTAAGFAVKTVAADLTREKTIDALRAFATEADGADWALVYYAGHGIELGGVNYLIPVDARLSADRDVALEAVSLDQLMGVVGGAKKLRIVLLDACRDNPFAAQMKRTDATRSIGRGLGRVEPNRGTIVVYAAKHGSTASDGNGTDNGPFAGALVKRMGQSGLEIRRLFDLVRDDVLEATAQRQEPFVYSSLTGSEDFYFQAGK